MSEGATPGGGSPGGGRAAAVPLLAWTVVIPVKGTAAAKSRLGAPERVALAIALDTVAAAIEAVAGEGRRGSVVVVTSQAAAAEFGALGARAVTDAGTGLGGAVSAGILAAGGAVAGETDVAGETAVGVLLGDVPALLPAELAAALAAAERHPLSFVADADGVGTVLLAALPGSAHAPAFGPGSRRLHAAAGYVELPVDGASGLRRDVDTPAQLAALAGRLGPRTVAALRG